MHKYCEHILNIWTQLETDLIYQISNFKEPNSTIKDILKNGIENKVKLWSFTYKKYYKSRLYNIYRNEIFMTYPTIEHRDETFKNCKLNIPYAKDLMENRDQLREFRRKMNDTNRLQRRKHSINI